MTNAALAATETLPSALPDSVSDVPQRDFAVVAGQPKFSTVPLFFTALFFLILSVAGILAINISVSQQQYALVALKKEQSSLQLENASLSEKIDNAQAPQILGAKAQKLGLVYSSAFATIDINKAVIGGNRTPANGSENFAQGVPAPLSPRTRAAVAPTVSAEKVKASQVAVHSANLNGGTVPAPAQKTAPAEAKASKKP